MEAEKQKKEHLCAPFIFLVAHTGLAKAMLPKLNISFASIHFIRKCPLCPTMFARI